MLDYFNAFGTLSHSIPLSILSSVGLDTSAVKMLSNYLSDRLQSVKIDENKSNTLCVSSGVPQDSILGPLLYALYTSELIKVIKKCRYHIYADDTQLYFTLKMEDLEDAITTINKELKTLVVLQWRLVRGGKGGLASP